MIFIERNIEERHRSLVSLVLYSWSSPLTSVTP